jgi:uncharacterized protein
VKLNIHDIEDAPKELAYEEPTQGINQLLVHGAVCDFEFPAPVQARLQYYRAGEELLFQGRLSGTGIGHCARCLDEYPFNLSADFSAALVRKRGLPSEVQLSGDELDLSYYEGDEVDLSPLVCEQIILALPTRPLCRESCKGLCPRCGANLNAGACGCPAAAGAPWLAVLRNLLGGLSPAARAPAARTTGSPQWLYRSERRLTPSATSGAPTTRSRRPTS